MPSDTVAIMQQAARYHQAGQLDQAQALYRQVLSQEPRNSAASNLLGVVAYQTGNNAEALKFIEQATAIDPLVADYQTNLAKVYLAMNRYDDAVESARRGVQL